MADLLRHESGFANFPVRLESVDLLTTENIKKNLIGKVIRCKIHKNSINFTRMWRQRVIVHDQIFEDSAGPAWPLAGKREYHAISRSVAIDIAISNKIHRNPAQLPLSNIHYIYRGMLANEVFRRAHPKVGANAFEPRLSCLNCRSGPLGSS